MKASTAVFVSIIVSTSLTVVFAATKPRPTAAEIQAFLQLTGGQRARMAWDINVNREAWGDPAKPATIMKMDAADAAISELTPNSVFPSGTASTHVCSTPFITDDGSRVIFMDYQEAIDATYSSYVINWNGTGIKRWYYTGPGAGTGSNGESKHIIMGHWRHPATGADYAIVSIQMDALYRINIDNPSDKVLLWNKSINGVSPDAVSVWATMSRDGTRMVLNPHPATILVSNPGASATYTTIQTSSCYPSISPDNSYNILPQNGTHSVHTIYNPDGSTKTTINTATTILASYTNSQCGGPGETEYEHTRYSNNPNFYTFFCYYTNENPFIGRISDKKFLHVDVVPTDPTKYCLWSGHPTLAIFTATGALTAPSQRITRGAPSGATAATFTLDGRRVHADLRAKTSRLVRGVVLRADLSGTAITSRQVIFR